MPAYIDVNAADFQAKVLDSEIPVLVDFWAPWCGPCRVLGPTVEKVAEKYAGRITVAKINVDENQRIAVDYGISGIPALLVFKGGELVNRGQGNMPQARVEKLLEPAL